MLHWHQVLESVLRWKEKLEEELLLVTEEVVMRNFTLQCKPDLKLKGGQRLEDIRYSALPEHFVLQLGPKGSELKGVDMRQKQLLECTISSLVETQALAGVQKERVDKWLEQHNHLEHEPVSPALAPLRGGALDDVESAPPPHAPPQVVAEKLAASDTAAPQVVAENLTANDAAGAHSKVGGTAKVCTPPARLGSLGAFPEYTFIPELAAAKSEKRPAEQQMEVLAKRSKALSSSLDAVILSSDDDEDDDLQPRPKFSDEEKEKRKQLRKEFRADQHFNSCSELCSELDLRRLKTSGNNNCCLAFATFYNEHRFNPSAKTLKDKQAGDAARKSIHDELMIRLSRWSYKSMEAWHYGLARDDAVDIFEVSLTALSTYPLSSHHSPYCVLSLRAPESHLCVAAPHLLSPLVPHLLVVERIHEGGPRARGVECAL